MITKNPRFGLNLLPIYNEALNRRIELSSRNLEIIKGMSKGENTINTRFLQRKIHFHQEQNTNNRLVFEQCRQWRDLSPTQQEWQQIVEIEKKAALIEKVNHDILVLASALSAEKYKGSLKSMTG